MFETKVFWKQIYWIQESICNIAGTFRALQVLRRPGHCAPHGTPLVYRVTWHRALELDKMLPKKLRTTEQCNQQDG